MNIVYLIGNGFDLAQDLKTSYKEFYKSYKSSHPVNEIERRIIESITENVENWSDLERSLGTFTNEVNDADGFAEAYESLYLKLKDHLLSEENRFSAENIERYRKELSNPFADLSYLEQQAYHKFLSGFIGATSIVNIISFNYTDVFERAIGYQYQSIPLKGVYFRDGIQLNNVYKVHGSLRGTFLMGVNDSSQIANSAFSTNPDICDFLVKPRINQNLGQYFDRFAIELIGEANLIIVFGMSIGETDKLWWKQVAERLKAPNVKMIIFHHPDSPIPEDRKWKEEKEKRRVKKHFEDVAEVSKSLREELDAKITVTMTGKMFNPHVVRYEVGE